MDSDTKERIEDVKITIYTDNDSILFVNNNDYKCLKILQSESCKLIKLSHVSYNQIVLKKEQLKDTLYVKPKDIRLDEVVVNKPFIKKNNFFSPCSEIIC